MNRKILLVLVFALLSLSAYTFALKSDDALLVLSSNNYSDTQTTISSLDYLGVQTMHVIGNRTLIARVPTAVESQVRSLNNVSNLYRGTAPSGDPDTTLGIATWNYLLSPTTLSNEPNGRPLVNDFFHAPLSQSLSGSTTPSPMPGYTETSEYLIGRVSVGVILPESTGSGENWSTTRQNKVFYEIVRGLNWWTERYNKLSFYYETKFSVSTSYEPITMSGTSDIDTWLSNVFQTMGYTSGTSFDRGYAYINDLRTRKQTDWTYTFVVVDSLNDTDGMFTSNYFGWAYIGGPFVIMTYDNDGWGINRMNQVASHETGHIFGAGDEYCQEGYACCDSGYYGYLNVYNGNCAASNPNSVACVMNDNSDAICSYSVGQIGRRDSDSDGIPDPIDNVVTNAITSVSNPSVDRSVTITGSATDVPYDSPTYSDVTINKITTVKYRIDNGAWFNATPLGGNWNDSNSESYTLTTGPLSPARHTVDIQGYSSSGNTSQIATQILDFVPPVVSNVTDGGVFAYDDSQLTARWTATDTDSQITECDYAIGTTPTDPGASYIRGWTSVGAAQTGTATNLSLAENTTYYFYVKAKNASGIWSDVAVSDGITPKSITIGESKLLPDGTQVALKNKIATGTIGNAFYIEEPSKSSGIKVTYSSLPAAGLTTTVRGQLGTDGQERKITAGTVVTSTSNEFSPIFMTNRAIGGKLDITPELGVENSVGLYNLGLLIKTSGEITYVDPTRTVLYIDDGSRLDDGNALGDSGTAVTGIRVIVPSAMDLPSVGVYLSVTGISSFDSVNKHFVSALKIRTTADIVPITGGSVEGTITSRQISTTIQINQSSHPYTANYNRSWTITGPAGTTKMRVHFSSIELESNKDFLYIKDSTGAIKQTLSVYPGSNDLWTDWIDGNKITLNLVANGSVQYYGIYMDKYQSDTGILPMSGVTVTLTPGARTIQTKSDGKFKFIGILPGTYTLTPTFSGATFTPTSKNITIIGQDSLNGADFSRN